MNGVSYMNLIEKSRRNRRILHELTLDRDKHLRILSLDMRMYEAFKNIYVSLNITYNNSIQDLRRSKRKLRKFKRTLDNLLYGLDALTTKYSPLSFLSPSEKAEEMNLMIENHKILVRYAKKQKVWISELQFTINSRFWIIKEQLHELQRIQNWENRSLKPRRRPAQRR